MVGKIIGKGGATIRELQDASGAHIDIAKQCAPGMTQREITITGGPAQMAYCNLLLQGKICEGDMSHPAYQQAYANYSQVYAQTQGGAGGYAQGGGYGCDPCSLPLCFLDCPPLPTHTHSRTFSLCFVNSHPLLFVSYW